LAFQTTREAVRVAEESGDILAKAFSYPFHGCSCYGKGFLDDAEKYLLKALEITERANHHLRKAGAHFFLGWTYFDMGDFPRSKEHLEKGIQIYEDIRLWPSGLCVGKVCFARAKVLNKEKDVNLETLYGHARNTKVKFFQGQVHRYIGEILLNIDDQHMSEAEQWIQKAIETDQGNGTNFYLGKDYALYADFFNRKGDRIKAQENLGKATEIFKECGADGWVTRTEQKLASLG
jgi:tetratricopeptide (TPR) repeat protein